MTDNDDLFKGLGIKVLLKSDFNKVREVLTRIGIANNKKKTLTQSCHIFHKRGQYAIMHFLEMFQFDGKQSDFTEEDEARRNRIVSILDSWGLVEIDEKLDESDPIAPFNSITILNRAQVEDDGWNLVKKYTLGNSNVNATKRPK